MWPDLRNVLPHAQDVPGPGQQLVVAGSLRHCAPALDAGLLGAREVLAAHLTLRVAGAAGRKRYGWGRPHRVT